MQMRSTATVLWGVLIAIVVTASRASARRLTDDVEIHMAVKASADPKAAPEIEATIIGARRTALEQWWLSTTIGHRKVTVPASRVRSYAEGTETIAIALVVQGQEAWIGNDEYETTRRARYQGALNGLAYGIDLLHLGQIGPPGSKGVIVTYSRGAELKLPMSELEAVTGAALGSQREYRGNSGTDMVRGIRVALDELAQVETSRKALIVIGDGNDTNDVARSQLLELKKDAAKANVQLFGIIYKSPLSNPGSDLHRLVPHATQVTSVDGITGQLNAIVERLSDRFYVTFAGYDERTKTGLPWDGHEHELVVQQGAIEYEPVTLQLGWDERKPVEPMFSWAAMLATIGVALLLLIVLVTSKTSKVDA